MDNVNLPKFIGYERRGDSHETKRTELQHSPVAATAQTVKTAGTPPGWYTILPVRHAETTFETRSPDANALALNEGARAKEMTNTQYQSVEGLLELMEQRAANNLTPLNGQSASSQQSQSVDHLGAAATNTYRQHEKEKASTDAQAANTTTLHPVCDLVFYMFFGTVLCGGP